MIEETLLDATEKMGKAVEHVQTQFLGVRTGRASASLVDKIQVEYFGAFVPLLQLASFHVPEARMLVVKPHDRSSIAAIEKALQLSGLGLSPSNDGVVIRLSFPALTEERRKEFVKIVKNMAEEGRVAARNLRRDARKILETSKKDGDISQDEIDRAEKDLDHLTQSTVDAIDKAVSRKEHELLEV
ncbi:MAG: ribosome recycling factor [Acidimicrobiaceae bacterium]|nr:ribosome recycling factor [Acidimicrobiaceae bacterium]